MLLEGMPQMQLKNRNYPQPGAEFPATSGGTAKYNYQ
jgi:hypothetical protein